ncbi:MAG: hypothetical protein QF494_04860 [Methylococcales bacterium]|nr:hypothetical protein [Methylococcales bacterium]
MPSILLIEYICLGDASTTGFKTNQFTVSVYGGVSRKSHHLQQSGND